MSPEPTSNVPPTTDPGRRFDGRVENYHLYRPGYPAAVAELLADDCDLGPDRRVADLGCGTGKLAALFLERGHPVYGIEPNDEMRRTAERELARHARFRSIAGTAEATGLADRSVDLAVAGQAFHWFDLDRTRGELLRILTPRGWLAVVWNERRLDATPFARAWERLLSRHALDYREVDHSRFDLAAMRAFFRPVPVRTASFESRQTLDRAGIRGRLLSCSYAPPPGHAGHEPMLAELDEIFERHAEEGRVTLEYDCRVYYGRFI